MKQSETLTNSNISKQKNSSSFYEAGQLRRARMHAARLIDSMDSGKMLTYSQHRLLEACLILETTNTKILAAYLQQSPAIIRNQFQRICTILGPIEALQKVSRMKIPSATATKVGSIALNEIIDTFV